jgi:hypothetical protein
MQKQLEVPEPQTTVEQTEQEIRFNSTNNEEQSFYRKNKDTPVNEQESNMGILSQNIGNQEINSPKRNSVENKIIKYLKIITSKI